MDNFKENDVVIIKTGNPIIDDISNKYIGCYAYVDKVLGKDNVYVTLCNTDISFVICTYHLEKINK